MNDFTQDSQSQPAQGQATQADPQGSYVDSYQPPATPAVGLGEPETANSNPLAAHADMSQVSPFATADAATDSTITPNSEYGATPDASMDQTSDSAPSFDQSPSSTVSEDSTAPATDQNQPSSEPAQSSQSAPAASSGPTESLADQNIFDLLGVSDGDQAERESFLDELQQVIWEDFLENDVKLLITSDEMSQLETIKQESQNLDEVAQQEKIITFLDGLIPDLEEIMLEKALELKRELVVERIAGMKEFHAGNDQALQAIEEANRLMSEDKWRSLTEKLNSIT